MAKISCITIHIRRRIRRHYSGLIFLFNPTAMKARVPFLVVDTYCIYLFYQSGNVIIL